MKTLTLLVASIAAGCGSSVGPSTFAEINAKVFQPSCAFSDSCHDATGSTTVADYLDLRDDPYDALVGAPARDNKAAADGLLRVKPGDSANSFLYWKLTPTTPDGPCAIAKSEYGVCMPNGLPPLHSDVIAGIKAWIDAGAQRN